ncbi:Sodium:neurotransmitter symporter family protein [Vibrio aerogenes CECT 7868]|uniref:Transporter n=1 Tax=Vibrio aerogenes CECT 7868 TaxID=1216006 RepID=A0A1M6DAB5_9VIBR|nr:sodium-dependent transporter [Vibrio aerogenes]SHI70167.1 Sodium:neurotransmitter symporter family protein [Vibrio aerogenes CECT 7868]
MKREQWGSRAGFILAAVGSAIGLGNIWRFPYMAYENGGGAFFIPYIFAMLTAGIPFMILEFSMGQRYRGSAPKTLSRIHAKFEWLGWFQVGVAAVIGVYYVAVIGWAISYFGLSFTQGWGSDPNSYFFSEYLGLGDNSPTNLGGIRWGIALTVTIAWAITYVAIVSGVKSGIERASKIMMPILFFMVLMLIARMAVLPGAIDGINYMFKPDFSKIWDVKVWAAAYGQIFFTLSIGFAIMLAYSSYLPEKSDITNNAFMTVLINCGFSILAGIMIFSVLGYMAEAQSKPLTEVVSAGVGLAFVTLPTAINLLPAPYILGPVLFFALVIAGLSSHISIMEAVTSAVIDKTKWRRNKAATVVIGSSFIVSMAFVTNGGLLLLDLVDHFANNIGIMVGCFVEIVIMTWLFKIADVRQYVNSVSDFSVKEWFDICLKFITPVILAIILVTKLKTLLTDGYGGYDLTIGWIMIAALFVIGVTINLTTKQQEA